MLVYIEQQKVFCTRLILTGKIGMTIAVTNFLICQLHSIMLPLTQMKLDSSSASRRNILDVLSDSLHDQPHKRGNMTDGEVRYKLIIDTSEDGSVINLLFSLGVLDRQKTRMYVCSDLPGDSQTQKVGIFFCAVFRMP